MNTKLIAVAAAAIVIIAAVAVYASGALNKGGDTEAAEIDAQLMLYGNADGDHTISQADLDIVNEVIAGNAELSDYPFADANADGIVDQTDVDIVSKLIDRQPTVAYVYCYDTANNPTAKAIQYPLEDVVVQSTNPTTIMCEIGAAGVVAGYFTHDPVVHSVLDTAGAVDLKGSAMKISSEAWMNFMNLDAEVGVGAIVTETGTDRLADFAGDIEAAQIPLLRFNTGDVYDSLSSAITLGFICGQATEESSVRYAELSFDAMKHIEQVLSALTEDQREVFVSLSMTTRISGTESDYTHKVELAGGTGLGDVSSEFAELYAGDTATKMESNEALSNFDSQLDRIFSFRTVDYSSAATAEFADYWADTMSYVEGLQCYQDLVFVNAFMPQVCQVAYVASVMYPELVTEQWADELLASFIEISGGEYSVDDVTPVFTYEDYQVHISG